MWLNARLKRSIAWIYRHTDKTLDKSQARAFKSMRRHKAIIKPVETGGPYVRH